MKAEETDIVINSISEWNKEEPKLDPSAMEIVGGVSILAKVSAKKVRKALQECNIYFTDVGVLTSLRR